MTKEKYKSVLKLPKTNYHILGPAGIVFSDSIKLFTKEPLSTKVVITFKGTEGELFMDTSKMTKAAEYILERIKKEPGLAKRINENTILYAKKFLELYKNLSEEKLKKYSNSELFGLWEKGFEYTIEKQKYGFVSSILDYFTNKITDELMCHLRESLEKKFKKVDESKIGDYYSILTRPTEGGITRKEKIDFLKISNKIDESPKLRNLFVKSNLREIIKKSPTNIQLLIKKHADEFGWLWYFYDGPSYTEKDFYKLLKIELNSGDVKKKLNEATSNNKNVIRSRNKIYKEINLGEGARKIFEIATEFLSTKNIEKELDSLGWSYRAKLYKEMSRRLKININLIKKLLPYELENALNHKKNQKSLLEKRFKFSVLIIEKGNLDVIEGKKAEIYIKDFEKLVIREVPKIEINELRGQTAFSGTAKGIVRIINEVKDISKMKKGDILVARLTNPDLILAVKMAAAIITDTGGITSHAAITSRELQIPCIVGTKIATDVLKDGDAVEVDASRGVINILKKK